jgi:hypothetical protein
MHEKPMILLQNAECRIIGLCYLTVVVLYTRSGYFEKSNEREQRSDFLR